MDCTEPSQLGLYSTSDILVILDLCTMIFYSTGLSSQSIWFDALGTCSAYDTCLTSCQACPLSENHNCFHFEDVTLECVFSSFYQNVPTGANDVCNSIVSATTSSSIATSTTALSAIPTTASSDTSSTDLDIIEDTNSTALSLDVIIGGGTIGGILIVVTCCVVVILCVCHWLRISKKSRNYSMLRISDTNSASTMQVASTTNETLSEQPEPTAPTTVYPSTTLTYCQEHTTCPEGYFHQGYPPPQGCPPQGYLPQEFPPPEYPPQEYNPPA